MQQHNQATVAIKPNGSNSRVTKGRPKAQQKSGSSSYQACLLALRLYVFSCPVPTSHIPPKSDMSADVMFCNVANENTHIH